jgi:hypothetical protein
MEKDLVEDIRYVVNEINTGTLFFSYLQDVSQAGNEFTEPVISDSSKIHTQESPSILWLANLTQENLNNK